jgi:hypothetical protein
LASLSPYWRIARSAKLKPEKTDRGTHMDTSAVLQNIQQLSKEFADERRERQRRRELVAADFDRLRDAGFLLTGVPVE